MPEGYTTIQEGSARILQRGNEVFYNPVQVRRAHREKGDARVRKGSGGQTRVATGKRQWHCVRCGLGYTPTAVRQPGGGAGRARPAKETRATAAARSQLAARPAGGAAPLFLSTRPPPPPIFQVVNRDLSIAVLRVFAARLAAEAASGKKKKRPKAPKAAAGAAPDGAPDGAAA